MQKGTQPSQTCYGRHITKIDPKSMRVMPLCLWGVQTRLGQYNAKLILASIRLWRVGIDGRSYAAAPMQISNLLRRQLLRHKTSAWASGGPARQMCSGTEQIFARPVEEIAWRQEARGRKKGVGLLLPHWHTCMCAMW
jgi:hypothetical protein